MHGFTKKLTALLLVALLAPALAAETVRYEDSWAGQGVTVLEQGPGGLELIYSIESWQWEPSAAAGEPARRIVLPGAFLPNDAGAPDLPGQGWLIALPNGASARLEILEMRTETLEDFDLIPAFRLPREDEDGPLDYSRDPAIWSRDADYPAEPVMLGEGLTLRGVDAVTLGVTPFRYNPVRRTLTVLRDIRLALRFEGGDGVFGRERFRSRHWDPILRSSFLNGAALPALDHERAEAGLRTPDYEYVILCQDDPGFTAWADSIRVFRNEQGIRTGVYTLDEIGGNTQSAIEGFVNDAYLNWEHAPSAVLLLGDYGTGGSGVFSPTWNSYCVSDNIYADVDGDNLPELAFARICAQDEAELGHMVTKALDYERHPPGNPGFYANPVIAGGWQTERWFILCDEVIYGFLENEHGKSPVREYAIYDGTPGGTWSTAPNTGTVVNYFGPSGLGYIPSTPDHLTDWGGNATRLNADINAGAFILQHRDHGGENGWGEPYYVNSHLSGLSNDDLTFVFSINCLTGKYNWSSECFTEAFHRHDQGALGLIAASEISYSFVNDAYVWGMFDYFWPDFDPGYGDPGPHRLLPAFGNAYGKIYLHASSWPYNTGDKTVTYFLFHHHGDAFTSVHSELPQEMAVVHDDVLLSGLEEFTVTAEMGALIGISRDGEYLGSATATGMPVNVTIPPQIPGSNAVVTVSMQNRLRYRAEIPVVPPDGPYLIYSEAAVEDGEGDGDGHFDEAETAGLTLSLENVGIEGTAGVSAVLGSEDPHVTVLEDTRSFPDIPAGGFGSNADPFVVAVAGNVPDQHTMLFTFEASGSGGSWDGSFQLTAQAPVLEARGLDVIDVPGGDGSGTADPGETFSLRVDVGNVGHSDAAELTALLTSSDLNAIVHDGDGACELIAEGGEATIQGFQVEILAGCPVPSTIPLRLRLSAPGGFMATLDVELPVGGWFDDFDDDHGWTVGGDAATGIWTRVDPNGTTYESWQIQPEDDHTPAPGTLCFVTGQGSPGGSAGENDVDGGSTMLLSPVFDLEGATEATVSYWRWYTNARGNNPDADWWDVEVTADGGNWVSLEHTMESQESWVAMSFDLHTHIPLTGHVQLRFVASDESDPSLVEAGVDDFLLSAYFPIVTDAPAGAPRLALGANFPNPFNPKTAIRFELPYRARTELAVFDVNGRRVATLVDGVLDGGAHEAVWEGRDDAGLPVSSGIYFSRLCCAGRTLTSKMLLLK